MRKKKVDLRSNTCFQRYNGLIAYFKTYECVLIEHLDKNICIVYKPRTGKFYLFSKGFAKYVKRSNLTKDDKYYVPNIDGYSLYFKSIEEAKVYYEHNLYGGNK